MTGERGSIHGARMEKPNYFNEWRASLPVAGTALLAVAAAVAVAAVAGWLAGIAADFTFGNRPVQIGVTILVAAALAPVWLGRAVAATRR